MSRCPALTEGAGPALPKPGESPGDNVLVEDGPRHLSRAPRAEPWATGWRQAWEQGALPEKETGLARSRPFPKAHSRETQSEQSPRPLPRAPPLPLSRPSPPTWVPVGAGGLSSRAPHPAPPPGQGLCSQEKAKASHLDLGLA